MSQTLMEKLTATPEGMRLYQQERAIQEITDLVCQIMEEEKVSRAEMAKRLGRTKGYITQLLDGRTNMTIRTMSDVLAALDRALHFQDGPLSATVGARPLLVFQATWSSPEPWAPTASPISVDPGTICTQRRMVS